jgi:hypothetical protein
MSAAQAPAAAPAGVTAGGEPAAPAAGSAVTPALTRDVKANPTSRTGRYVETSEYLKAAERFVAAAGRRVADGLEIGDLAALDQLNRNTDDMLHRAARQLHDQGGYSWGEIAAALGVKRQTVFRRFAKWAPATTTTEGTATS